VPEFITLFEEQARDQLKTRFNEINNWIIRGSTATNGSFPLPDDFWAARQVVFGSGQQLEYLTPAEMNRRFGRLVTHQLGLDELDPLGNLDTLTVSFDDEAFYTIVGGNNPAGKPLFYTIEGLELRVAPPPDDLTLPLMIDYEQGVPALGPRVQTNWLLTRYPSLYLFGSLAMAEAFIGNDERIPGWISSRDAGFERVRMTDIKARIGGAPLQIRVDGPTP
jgi:hypothetical protein